MSALTLDQLTDMMNNELQTFIDKDMCLVCGEIHCKEHAECDIYLESFGFNGAMKRV